eukprot:2594378-Rhodomonas_salina.1
MTVFRGSAGSPVSLPSESDLRLCGRNWGRDLGITASLSVEVAVVSDDPNQDHDDHHPHLEGCLEPGSTLQKTLPGIGNTATNGSNSG